MWFDPITSWVVSLFTSGVPMAKEKIGFALEKEIPAENWANEELYHRDIMNGVPVEKRMKNLENGKYKLTESHPEPHRDPVSGKIVIENCKLYHEDVEKYGAYQAQQWVKQGKYNLTPEELRKEHMRIEKKYKYMYSLLK